jgi:hypothetical protein
MACWNPSTLHTNVGLQELSVGIPVPQIPMHVMYLCVRGLDKASFYHFYYKLILESHVILYVF